MTLFIAWLLIDGFHLDPWLHFWAVLIWLVHLAVHSEPSADTIAQRVKDILK